jgi:hypothetical protein
VILSSKTCPSEPTVSGAGVSKPFAASTNAVLFGRLFAPHPASRRNTINNAAYFLMGASQYQDISLDVQFQVIVPFFGRDTKAVKEY